MRILYFTHYFFPEGNAPATRVYEMSRRWVRQGHEVTVITGVPNVPDGVAYPGYRNRWLQRERIEGVDVIRVWTYLAANKGTLRRILNYVSFMGAATLAGLFVRRPQVVIATSPQFFCGWAGVFVSGLRRLPFVLEVRDLWPESIVAVGAMRNPRLIRFLEWLEHRMYAAATRIVTVGEGYRGKLVERSIAPERIEVIPNGVDLEAFQPRAPDAAVRAEWNLGERFVCAYVGTIGMGSGLEVVLRASRRLRALGRDDIRFLLVGDGAVREALESATRAEGLSHVVFTGRLPKSRMPEILAASDACLVHLTRTELFKTVLPSKIFEAAAMQRPIILGVAGFAAELVSEAQAGICIEPENDTELVEAVTKLADDPALARRLGASAYEGIAKRHAYAELAGRYLSNLEKLVAEGASR
ncbi:MAG: glycosyltransferase family 4 protein [Myxococcales bacterium]|nr:glycosyltransferase family 4 protein [Myxococcales bacterium]